MKLRLRDARIRSLSGKQPRLLVATPLFIALGFANLMSFAAIAAEISTDPVQVIHGDMRRHLADKAQLRVLAEGFSMGGRACSGS